MIRSDKCMKKIYYNEVMKSILNKKSNVCLLQIRNKKSTKPTFSRPHEISFNENEPRIYILMTK